MNITQASPPYHGHQTKIRDFFNRESALTNFSRHYRNLLAKRFTKLIPNHSSILEVGCGEGTLLASIPAKRKLGIDLSKTQIEQAQSSYPDIAFQVADGQSADFQGEVFDVIILSDVLNYAADVESLLLNLQKCSDRNTRIIINIHNTLWRPMLGLARMLGLAQKTPISSWLSRQDVINLCALADWEVFKSFTAILCPLPIPGLATFLNRFVAPFISWSCLTVFLIGRSISLRETEEPTVSVIIPARNEAGNIPYTLSRIPKLGLETELIFIEGHSTDETWAAISSLPDQFEHGPIKKLRQTGKGKGNAVIEGFEQAQGDILMILDADLTMPPEDLPKFLMALQSGKTDFANGVRLVYPMDEEAMRFANLCANKGFSILFSWLLGQPIKDTLCGTKAMWRTDYKRLHANRSFFGDFDPFGDFDLIFGASKLNLKIMDVPVRYAERSYGTTNIQRWRSGVILTKMVWVAARKLKFVE